jgi:hypothetical protein
LKKHLTFFIPILVILLFLSGCNSSGNDNNTIGSNDNNTIGSNDNNTIGSNDNNTIGSNDNNTISQQQNNQYEVSIVDSVGNAPLLDERNINTVEAKNIEVYGGIITNENGNNTYRDQEQIYVNEALNFQYFIKPTSTKQKQLNFMIMVYNNESEKTFYLAEDANGQVSLTEKTVPLQQITLNSLSEIIKIDLDLYLEEGNYRIAYILQNPETQKEIARADINGQQYLSTTIHTKDQSTLQNSNAQTAGFLPNPNGFGFPNLGRLSPDDITSKDVAHFIGTNKACYNGDPENCILTAIGTFKKDSALEEQKGGQCYGFAVAAMMLHHGRLFDGKSYASDYNPEVSKTIDLKKHDVANLIAVKFLNQDTPQVREIRKADTDTLSEYQKVLDGFSGNDPIAVLTFFKATGDGGHAVTPYAITQEEDNKARIYVYDNNFPGRDDLYFDINLNNGHWRYTEGATNAQAQSSGGYHGEGSVNPFRAIPLSATLHEQLEEDITLNNTVKYGLHGGEKGIRMLISQGDKHAIGYDFETGQYVNNIEGAEEHRNFEDMSSDYILPLNPNLTDASTIETEAELSRFFNEVQTVEISTLPDMEEDTAEITLSMQASSPSFYSALSVRTYIEESQKNNVAFHPKGRMFIIKSDITKFIAEIENSDLEESQKESLYPSLNIHFDDRELMRGYIYKITLKNIPDGAGVAAFIGENGATSIFAFKEESDEIVDLSETIHYAVKSAIVDQHGYQKKSIQTLTQPMNSGMRLRPVYKPSGIQAKSKGQDVIIERIF